jgi:hypothetical protein
MVVSFQWEIKEIIYRREKPEKSHFEIHHRKGETKVIYTSFNRSKKWFFKRLNRYQNGNADRYRGQSRASLRRTGETDPGEKDLIISTRKRLESEPYVPIGVSAIQGELTKPGTYQPFILAFTPATSHGEKGLCS